ncbi:MAG TPA: hypothetical protein V6D29_07790 [Leptolyngbyaceae cyanobacterium]
MALSVLGTVFDITPPVLYLPEDQCVCSLVTSRKHLYLAACQQLTERPSIVASIYRYDDSSDQWQLLERRFLSAESVIDEANTELLERLECKAAVLDIDGSDWLLAYFASSSSQQLIGAYEGEQFVDFNVPEIAKECFIQQFLYAEGHIYALWAHQRVQLEPSQMTLSYAPLIGPQGLGDWQTLELPQADGMSHATSVLAYWNNRLYAAISNEVAGFELWCKEGVMDPWQKIHDQGLYRYCLNAQVRFLVSFKEALYLATDSVPDNVYSNGFELIRLYPDNDWDLMVGMPRFTPMGLRVPLLCQGPGFDTAIGGPVCLTVHDGSLYLGFQTLEGFQLWRSTQGNTWSQVAVPSLSQYYQINQLEAASTPNALALMCTVQESPGTSSRRLFAYE